MLSSLGTNLMATFLTAVPAAGDDAAHQVQTIPESIVPATRPTDLGWAGQPARADSIFDLPFSEIGY